jgi:hypothetical protein
MGDRREFRNSLLLGLALTGISLALHFAPVWETMLNRGAETWDGHALPFDYIVGCIEEHRHGPEVAFTRRPLTTASIDALQALGIPPVIGFMIVGFGLFFLAGLLVHRIARNLGPTPLQALLAQLAFHAAPTVLFAWFDPMYTYDEPIQYAALLLALMALLDQKTWAFIIAFSFALLARETSLLVLPAFAWIMRSRPREALIVFATPLLIYALFLVYFLAHTGTAEAALRDLAGRASFLSFNFRNVQMLGESLGYMALVLVLPVFLLARFQKSKACSDEERTLLRAFWIALVLNTIVVLLAAKAREARLFALPMIFAWPLLGKVITAEIERGGGLRSFLSFLRKPLWAIGFVVKSTVLIISVRKLFVLSTGIQQDNLFHEYLIGELLLILICLYAAKHNKRSHLRAA